MQPFVVRVRPSRGLIALSLLLHGAAFTLCIVCFDGLYCLLGTGALALSLVHALHTALGRSRFAVAEIHIDRKGRAVLQLRRKQTAWEAELLSDSLIHPYACFLRWKAVDRTFTQCLPADAADREAYRRLLVWARYGQPREEK